MHVPFEQAYDALLAIRAERAVHAAASVDEDESEDGEGWRCCGDGAIAGMAPVQSQTWRKRMVWQMHRCSLTIWAQATFKDHCWCAPTYAN